MSDRYIENDFSVLRTVSNSEQHLTKCLTELVTSYPPKAAWTEDELGGLMLGPTGTAYLFLHISRSHPTLIIANKSPLEWGREYLAGDRSDNPIESVTDENCGMACDYLAHLAISAAYSKDLKYVREFLALVPKLLTDGSGWWDWCYGRAGTLYYLRLIRSWVPEAGDLVREAITQLCELLLRNGDPWIYRGREVYGIGHGHLGIIAQIVLSDASYAPQLEKRLVRLLDLQLDDGNWPKEVADTNQPGILVQLCHGAPGFVVCLLSLREYFPALKERIDEAVIKGREVTWKRGLLKKTPNICHGINGNALVFPPGERRDHFMSFVTEEGIQKGADEGWWDAKGNADYGFPDSLMFGLGGRAWSWAVKDQEDKTYVAFDDL